MKEKKIKEKPEKPKSELLPKILKIAKIIILIVMIVASYILSDKIIDFLATVDLIILKRALNIVLITVIMGIYFKK